jgi:hypothetical protein
MALPVRRCASLCHRYGASRSADEDMCQSG